MCQILVVCYLRYSRRLIASRFYFKVLEFLVYVIFLGGARMRNVVYAIVCVL